MVNILFFLGVMVAFFAVYIIIHHGAGWTSLGRISSAIVVGGGAVLDQLQALPWGSILDQAKVELVGFALAASMIVLHVIQLFMDAIKSPQAPPAA